MLMGVFLFASSVPESVMAVSAYREFCTQLQPPACHLKSLSAFYGANRHFIQQLHCL